MYAVEYADSLWHRPITWWTEGRYDEEKYAQMIADWMRGLGHRVRVRDLSRGRSFHRRKAR